MTAVLKLLNLLNYHRDGGSGLAHLAPTRVSIRGFTNGSMSRRGNTKLVILMAVLQCQSRSIFYASGFGKEPTAVLLCTLRQTLLPTV